MKLPLILGLCALATGCAGSEIAEPVTACRYSAGETVIALPGRPFAVEPTPDGCWIFASLVSGGVTEGQAASDSGATTDKGGIAVLKNDGGRFRLVRVSPVPGEATGIALSHDGAILAVAAGDVSAILDVQRLKSGETDAALGVIPQGEGAEAIDVAISSDDGLLFTSDEETARVTVADLARARREGFDKDNVIGRIPAGGGPVSLALSPDGRRMYITSQEMPSSLGFPSICPAERGGEKDLHSEGGILTVDIGVAAENPAQALVAVAPAGCNPVRVALSPDGTDAWVTARGSSAVLYFKTDRLETTPSMTTRCTPSVPLAKLVCPARRRDPPHETIVVGSSPVGIAISPDGKDVWVTNSNRFADTGRGFMTLIHAPTEGQLSIGGRIASGVFPRDVKFLPDGKTLVAAVFGSKELEFVQPGGK